jgi:phosphoribosylglycinamide formyltransferase 1
MTTSIAILASGSGTNAQALVEASRRGELAGGEVVVVVSDREGSGALQRAQTAGVEALFLDPSTHPDREVYAAAIVKELRARNVGLVCLAGFMRILPPSFVKAFENRILNLHPALLPAFPGANAVRDALAWGAKVTGTTVHFVDEEVDHGPIVLQEAVPVLGGDTEESLHERIKEVERRLYPEAVRLVLGGRTRIEGRAVVIEEPEGARA